VGCLFNLHEKDISATWDLIVCYQCFREAYQRSSFIRTFNYPGSNMFERFMAFHWLFLSAALFEGAETFPVCPFRKAQHADSDFTCRRPPSKLGKFAFCGYLSVTHLLHLTVSFADDPSCISRILVAHDGLKTVRNSLHCDPCCRCSTFRGHPDGRLHVSSRCVVCKPYRDASTITPPLHWMHTTTLEKFGFSSECAIESMRLCE
jgi:hypothetical protein